AVGEAAHARERELGEAGGRVLAHVDLQVGLAAVAEVLVAALDVLDHPLDLLVLELDLARALRDRDRLPPFRTGEEDVIGERRLHEAPGERRAGMLGAGNGTAPPVLARERGA